MKLMARRTKATQPEDKVEGPEKETPEALHAAVPLFDQSDVAVRKMIKAAKKRDYIAHEQINSVLPSEAATSEQIEDILAVLNEVGIHTVQSEEAEPEEEVEAHEEPEEEESEGGELVEVQRAAPAKGEKAKPSERTDDPVRMYLREMGSLEPLSRAGEIAIAKRIAAGREAMITGLCESPLTFQAIIIWRDELNGGKVFLRDIIDLEATYAGPDAKAVPPAVQGVPGVVTPAGANSVPAGRGCAAFRPVHRDAIQAHAERRWRGTGRGRCGRRGRHGRGRSRQLTKIG